MSGIKVDLQWSPHHNNRFITIGSDIQLYEIEEFSDGPVKFPSISVGEGVVANLVTTNSDHPYLKCVSWHPEPQYDQLLAIASANGKVTLIRLEENADDSYEFGSREFTPRHSRPCNCVAWNPNDPKLLACGLEKNRAECGLLIWDIQRQQTFTEPYEKRHTLSSMFSGTTVNTVQPTTEIGMSDSIHSLHWFNRNPHLLVCGANSKHIKIYDLRDPSKHQNSTPTKAVYGVCVDPYCDHRLASISESLFILWDIRNFEKPVVTTHEQKQYQKISWCPTRCNLLAVLLKESDVIKLFSIQSSSNNDEVEPTIDDRKVHPFETAVMSFAWHPTQENRMVTIAQNNKILDYTVFDRISINWSPKSEFTWTSGKNELQFIDTNSKLYESLDDISVKMQKRAHQGYGLITDNICMNGILSNDPALLGVWFWIDTVKGFCQEKSSRGKQCPNYEGVYTIVCGETGTLSNSEPVSANWVAMNFHHSMTKYLSEERDKALLLCGWASDSKSAMFSNFLESLEYDGKHSRAAAISVFNLDIRKAVEILNRGSNSKKKSGFSDLNAVAMAVAGYTEDKSGLWQEINNELKYKLSDPHLRAMFSFLTTEDENYDEILDESGIAFQDRLAFALTYLHDKKLADFLGKLKLKMCELGNLDGILLTGLTNDGLALIQQYVNQTADVQTASLIILHTLPSYFSNDPRPMAWVEAYRHLLDVWGLWNQRAKFDVLWFRGRAENKPPQQIFVRCNFCGKSVSNYFQISNSNLSGTRFSQSSSAPAQKTKVTCCPSCRKPLPRCSLCLSHMGTPAGIYWKRPIEGKQGKKLTDFSNWLSWCHTCRHGGHSAHLLGWFEEHSECPITGCTCKCMALDSVAKLESAQETI